jgi:hypothetical protein
MDINTPSYIKLDSLITNLSNKPIIKILKEHGKVYLVGGAIRSILGNETPNDIDLFVTMDVESIINLIDQLKKADFMVRHELKRDYEGWSTKDLIMIHPTNKTMKESYDIAIGHSTSTHTHDFDVNSLFVELQPSHAPPPENRILHTGERGMLGSISSTNLQTIIEHINEKKLSFDCTIESLRKNVTTIYGPGQLMKRLMKRINYGWTIVNNPVNIIIVEYLLNVVHSGLYRQNAFKRECGLAIANLMKFMMDVNFDLKSFVREEESDFSKRNEHDIDRKIRYFTNILNQVANKRTKMFDTELCKKIMIYCDIKYEKWDVGEHEYMGVYSLPINPL